MLHSSPRVYAARSLTWKLCGTVDLLDVVSVRVSMRQGL